MEIENPQTVKIQNLETLNAYYKSKVKPNFWNTIISAISKKHLLKRKFSVALEMGDDPVTLKKLEKLTFLMCRKGINKRNLNKRNLVLDSLTYIFIRQVLNSNYYTAKDSLRALSSQIGNDEQQEKDNLFDRIKYVLQPSYNRSKADIKTFSQISKTILQLQENASFAILNIVLDLIVNEFNYEDAYNKLKTKCCKNEEITDSLLQITEYLLDKDLSSKKPDPLISSLLNGKNLLYDKKYLSEHDIIGAINSIEASTKNSILIQIPGIDHTSKIYIKLLNHLYGNKSGILDISELFFTGNSVPGWIKWTALRLAFITNGINSVATDHIFKHDGVFTAMPYYLYLLCYAEPSILKYSRTDILRLSSFKACQILFNLYGWDHNLNKNNIHIDISSVELEDKAIFSFTEELTKSSKRVCKKDIEISFNVFKARKKILQGFFDEGKEDLKQLLDRVKQSGAIFKLWWEPFIIYWLSMAHAHSRNLDEAIQGLKSLIPGPKANEAIGQLALCLIKKNDFEAAQEVLNTTDAEHPGTLYAKALLAQRLNDVKLAEKLIAQFIKLYGKEQKLYYNACIKLLALIKESQGCLDSSVSLLQPLLNDKSNQDKVVAIRISRNLVRQTYLDCKSSVIDKASFHNRSKILDSVGALIPSTLREYRLKLLFRIMIDTAMKANQLSSLKKRVPNEYAWQQLLLIEFIKSKDFSAVINLLKSTINSNANIILIPKYYIKTTFSVASWSLLINLWKSFTKDKVRLISQFKDPLYRLLLFGKEESIPAAFENWGNYKILRHFKHSLQDHFEDSFEQNEYLGMINSAFDIQQGILSVDDPDTGPLSESLFLGLKIPKKLELARNVLSLIFHNPISKKETFSSEIISFCVENESHYTDEQINIARLLAFWHKKEYKKFMELEEAIELNPNIPINPEHLWLAKAFIWFKNEEYELIFNSEMPQQIADLSNDDACILMAKASARLAYKSWKSKKNQEALNHIKQAASTLHSLKQIEQTEKT